MTFLHLKFIVDFFPLGFKSQGIHKIHDSILRNLIDDLRNHALSIGFHPVVDLVSGIFVEGCLIGACAIVIPVDSQEGLVHFEIGIILKPDRV